MRRTLTTPKSRSSADMYDWIVAAWFLKYSFSEVLSFSSISSGRTRSRVHPNLRTTSARLYLKKEQERKLTTNIRDAGKIRNIWPFLKDNAEANCYSHISHQTTLVASERLMMDKQPMVIIVFGELCIGTSISLRWLIVIRWFVIWNCIILSWSVCTWTFSRSFCIHFPVSNSRWIRSDNKVVLHLALREEYTCVRKEWLFVVKHTVNMLDLTQFQKWTETNPSWCVIFVEIIYLGI